MTPFLVLGPALIANGLVFRPAAVTVYILSSGLCMW